MIIKVCGMANEQNARQVAELSPDMMGFIFYPPSPRSAFELAPEFVKGLPDTIRKVGIFVDETHDKILRTVEKYRLDYVQLHGDETPDFCRSIKGKVNGLIKAFGIKTGEDLQRTEEYEGLCDLFIFDTKTRLKGGSGTKFDHNLLHHHLGGSPFLLSGGIGPEDLGILGSVYPDCAGLDLNSRFETSPGIKNTAILGKFINDIKSRKYEQDR